MYFVIFASDRRVSCKDLGTGDCEGWLYKRRDRSHGLFHKRHWKRHWCILKGFDFFYYKDDEVTAVYREIFARVLFL